MLNENTIRLKIWFDSITWNLSKFVSKPVIKYPLRIVLGMIFGYILYDFWMYGSQESSYDLFFNTIVGLVCALIAKLTKGKPDTVEGQNTDNFTTDKSDLIAGHKGFCEQCGQKVTINYGNAYRTLCERCV